jgi:type II secretory pathway pseudopilin PulG
VQLPSSHNRASTADTSHGFTLVELLVVIPIALLTIAALISLMVALIGDVLIARTRSVAVYELQNTLDRIETDTRATSTFLQSYSMVTSPQGRDGGTAAFNAASPNYDLILSQNATTGSPTDGTRNIVYYADQPNPCSGNYQLNRPLTVRIVYFTTNNPDGTKSLWRRVIVPSWTTTAGQPNSVCAAPWQRDNCPEGSTISASGPCQARDEKMLSSVSSFVPTYYDTNGNVTTDAKAAMSVAIGISQNKKIAGETIATTSSARSTRSNTTTDQAPSIAPTISILNPTLNSDNHPLLTSFTWNDISFASYYSLRYRINAGAWIYPPDQTDTTYRINSARPGNVINIEVTAKNDLGASPVGTYTYTKPVWTYANLNSGWNCYSSSWPCPSYTITTAGVVLLQGLAKDGASNTAIFTLPSSLVPNKQIIFAGLNSGGSAGRLDVATNGNVIWQVIGTGSSLWVSLDSVRYLSQSIAAPSWTTTSYGTNWVAYGGSWGVPQYTKDNLGRTHVYGLVKTGDPNTASTIVGVGTSNYQSPMADIYPAVTSPNAIANYQANSSGNLTARYQGSSSWFSVASMYHPVGTTITYNAPALQNSWVNYGGSYQVAGYAKSADNIVSLRGLIRAGTVTSGTTLFYMPAGYCPDRRVLLTTEGTQPANGSPDQTFARIDIWWDAANNRCEVDLVGTSPAVGNGWLSLANIHFLQER